MENDWYMVAAYESEPRFFAGVQCFREHYHSTDQPNVYNIIRNQRYNNQTRVNIEGQKVFEQNNTVFYQYDIEKDPGNSCFYYFIIRYQNYSMFFSLKFFDISHKLVK